MSGKGAIPAALGEKKPPRRSRPHQSQEYGTDLHLARRRAAVAELRLRGMRVQQMPAVLLEMGFCGKTKGGKSGGQPIPGKMLSHATVSGDIDYVMAQWRESARESIEQHAERILAQLQEVYRSAWERGERDATGKIIQPTDPDLQAALKSLKQQAELLGLDAPVKAQISGPDNGPIQIERLVADADALVRRMRGVDETEEDDISDADVIESAQLPSPARAAEPA